MDPFLFPAQRSTSRVRKRLLLALALCLGIALTGLALSFLFGKTDPGKHKAVMQIALIAPPPPPPKPPEPKPPEPPKIKEEVKLDNPKPVEEPKPAPEPPPAGPLGVDAQGTGPGDGFGLAGRPGGRDITVGGGGGVGGGSGLGLSLFGATTARHIAQELARDPMLKSTSYQIEIRIWLTRDGHFEREEIVRGTGDQELDARIRTGLGLLSSLSTPVPQNLPQPLRIRVTSSDA